jgi:ribose-phosphate pyrophosphokinase
MPLLFFACTAKELGAKKITLIAPYLGYMRQDKQFKAGQAVTSKFFADFLSTLFDSLITLDPHLHRYKSLDEIYSIPTMVLHASDEVGGWIKKHVKNPVLIGPDEESRQWVEGVAQKARAPFIVLKKIRHGDKDVEVSATDASATDVDKYRSHTPVLVDDIISTARTMIETVGHLNKAGMKPSVCIGIHAIFSGDSYEELKRAGVERIVTTNSVMHETNGIDVTGLFVG